MAQASKLRLMAGIIIFFGALTALSAWPPLNILYTTFADLVIWPATDTHRPLSADTRLTQAIMGGIFTGFGVLWWGASGTLYEQAPRETSRMLFAGSAAWFVTDSTASVLAGAAANVPPNAVFFVLMLWALKTPAPTKVEA